MHVYRALADFHPVIARSGVIRVHVDVRRELVDRFRIVRAHNEKIAMFSDVPVTLGLLR